MWKKGISLSAVIYLFLYLTTASMIEAAIQNVVWKDVSSGIRDSDLYTVTVSPDNAEIAYTGSSQAVYKTVDGGKSWDDVLSFRGTGNFINAIAINPVNTKVIYAGTQDGLYISKDDGMSWKRAFSGIGDLEDSIISAAISTANPEIIFIGTRAGIFLTENGGNDWKKCRNLHSGAVVPSIAIDRSKSHVIYAATDRGIYKSTNSGIAWERIFESGVPEDNNSEEYNVLNEVETDETSGIEIKIRSIVIAPADSSTVYAGTSKGLLITENGGLTWKMAGSSGLISHDIHHIAISPTDPDNVYAATSRGIFRYSKASNNWSELYKGLSAVNIRFLASAPTIHDRHTTLWAATKSGVFKTMSINNAVTKNQKMQTDDVLTFFADEPSIGEIQKAAIRYAEVHPEKIEGWRKAASKKAWLPDLRIGYDWDRDWQSSTYFYSTTTQKYKDDDITRGKDRAWSISLTWELGELIWNDDQTSIDTRSRLMVQLRDDVLNEVTRLYFERRRLQIEMLRSPSKDIKDRIEKELRLQELTADIDALTGFYLSSKLGQIRD